MTENLPAVRQESPSTAVVVARDTDSWADRLPAVVELARAIANTDFVPDSMRNNIAATSAAILYGREVGLPPMTALGNVNVIKGKPGLSAVIMRAQVLAAGHEIRQDESNSALCRMSGRRRGTDYWQTVEYTIDDARQAGLLSNQQYTKNPRRMLRARATSELCELMFADVVRGMPSLEELEDLDEDTPAGPAAPAARAKVQRKTRTTKIDDGPGSPAEASGAEVGAGSTPAGTPGPSSPPMPPLPGEPGYDDGPTDSAASVASPVPPVTPEGSGDVAPAGNSSSLAADQTDAGAGVSSSREDEVTGASAAPASPGVEPEDRPRPISRPQQRMLFARLKDLQIEDDAERYSVMSELLGEKITSSNNLTAGQAKTLIDALATCHSRDHVAALVDMARRDRADAQAGDD